MSLASLTCLVQADQSAKAHLPKDPRQKSGPSPPAALRRDGSAFGCRGVFRSYCPWGRAVGRESNRARRESRAVGRRFPSTGDFSIGATRSSTNPFVLGEV